jgi:hypothetical protein
MTKGDFLSGFQTEVPRGGFRWEQTNEGLILLEAHSRGAGTRKVHPFRGRRSSLFLEFAAVSPDPDGVLSFANEYGFLGFPVTLGWRDGVITPSLRDPPCELFDEHQAPSDKMEELREFRSMPPKVMGWVQHLEGIRLAISSVARQKAGQVAGGPLPQSLVDSDFLAVQGAVLGHLFATVLGIVIAPRFEWSRATNRFRLGFEPSSLVGALWLETATALTEQKRFRRCKAQGCEKIIELSTDPRTGRRADARYCSDACRSRAYRRRRARK